MKRMLLFLLGVVLCFPTFSYAQSQQSKNLKPFLGVETDDQSMVKATRLGLHNLYGRFVTQVYDNTAAERIGLQPFDYIVAINGEPLSKKESLSALLCKYRPDDEVRVRFYRDGAPTVRIARLGTCVEAKSPDKQDPNRSFLGVGDITNVHDMGGVQVQIVDHTTADRLMMQDDDVIVRINHHQIFNKTDLIMALRSMEPGDRIVVECQRDGMPVICEGHIESRAQTEARWLSDESNSEPLLPGDTDYEYHLEETLSELAKQRAAYVAAEPLAPYVAPEVNIGQVQAAEVAAMPGVSLDNNLRVEKLNFFPHEERGIFELTFMLFDQGDIGVKILNELGEEIYRYDIESFEGTFHDEVDLSNTPRGTYFLELSQNGKTTSKKITLS